MNICNDKKQNDSFIVGNLYRGVITHNIYIALDNGRLANLDSGEVTGKDLFLNFFENVTNQYCLQKVK